MDEKYWQERWEKEETPWDQGSASRALIAYCEQLADKDISILIPGAGNAYEADWLLENGFRNVTVLDWSQKALDSFLERRPDFPTEQAICGDFFALEGHFDLILEQTFFCALDPGRRPAYVMKMFTLLKSGATLAGLLFDFPFTGGPPFGGSEDEYTELFHWLFEVKKMERCYNSIKPREGKELFFILKKRILEG